MVKWILRLIISKTGCGAVMLQFLDWSIQKGQSFFLENVGGKKPNGKNEAWEKYVHLYLENLVFFRLFRHSDGL